MLNKIFFSERQVIKNKKDSFEGWYFRHDGAYKFSVIVGVSHAKADPHSFVQYIDKDTSHCFRFEKSALSFSKDGMCIKIENNIFSLAGIDLELKDSELSLKIKVGYLNHKLFKKSPYSPSVMGPFSYLPLNCNHALISLKHTVSGTIEVNNKRFYADGYGYIEKDFGNSFPKNYAWLHAIGKNASIMFALAYPLVFNMKGYLCVIHHDDKQYNLSKYTLAKLESFKMENGTLEVTIRQGKSTSLTLSSQMGDFSQPLLAPDKNGTMTTKIFETVSAPFQATLTLNNQKIDLTDISTCALELHP